MREKGKISQAGLSHKLCIFSTPEGEEAYSPLYIWAMHSDFLPKNTVWGGGEREQLYSADT